MAKFKTNVTAVNDGYGLSFDDIKKTPGIYQRRDGRILINATKYSTLVQDAKVRTGYTRTGMLMLLPNGTLRKPVCDRSKDGVKQWKKYAGKVELAV